MPPQTRRARALQALESETRKLDAHATYEERMRVEAAARGTSRITPYMPRSPAAAELSKERDSAHVSATKTDSTPLKSGGAADLGIDKLTRHHIEMQLAQELHGRRSKSADLVESIFGSIVDIDGASDILRELLDMSVVSVHTATDGELKEVTGDDRQAACAVAAAQAKEVAEPSKSSPADPYRWKWGLPVEASESAAALFLNVVAIASHAAALRIGNAQACPLPSLRFMTLPDPQRAVPLSNDSAPQDCRPDVVAFEYSNFHEVPSTRAPETSFLLRLSPFDYIRKSLPAVLNFTAEHRFAAGPAIADFEAWFDRQGRRNYLDMSRFCWPEVQLTVEAKLSDQYNAILQEFVYMRQQRRTQPWMRLVIGLVMTTKVIGVLRADALGIEQCTFDRACSRGILDCIRICLGIVRSTGLQRGHHEAFQLGDTKSHDYPHIKPKHAKRDKGNSAVDPDLDDVFAGGDKKVKEEQVEFNHRTVRFITLPGNRIHFSVDGTKPDVTYYVHHLVQDNGSLVGRCARIFCVSREMEKKDGVRQFVGPYALKIYNAEHTSDCYVDDLINKAREMQVKNVLLPTWEWYYGDTLSMRGFGRDVVKNYDTAAVVPTVVSNREEVFAQSDLKRLLVQCSSYNEFETAFIDFTQAISSLAENCIAHRDLSIGNVLLSQDTRCPPTFFSNAEAVATATLCTPVKFMQRELEQRMGGLLHDMDMAGRVHPLPVRVDDSELDIDAEVMSLDTPVPPERPAQPVGAQKGFRTGTPPFMAVGLLINGPPHIVAYDLHSLMFVMVLFFWTYTNFSDVPFPEHVRANERAWPEDVLEWTNRPVRSSLSTLGSIKRTFFANRTALLARLKHDFEGDLWMQGDRPYIKLFFVLYLVLWKQQLETSAYEDRHTVTAEEVEAALVKSRNKRLESAGQK